MAMILSARRAGAAHLWAQLWMNVRLGTTTLGRERA
ncbi:hypothetical protein MELE44368_01920 [Mycolicibacterium elephantis DSM 44368]|uniref:Uncharacterized protein n=1 Tax=Mycolicibacterium elephantis DSM 44368 TaxID=1335622 RepID=A0A439E0P1_9MYCO|nr:hypothetical protein MELE44368_01920 [Mycolicibacterium elephantis DSM 44368]